MRAPWHHGITPEVADGLGAKLVHGKMRLEWGVAGLVFCVFCLISLRHSGPAYLSDEISYLGHAARIAGYAIDGVDGAHAGYSLVLAPLFRVFRGPEQVWQGVMLLNALMWAGSFVLLSRIVARLFPDRTPSQRQVAVVVAAIYPAWVTMSGYAFATTAIVLMFMLSVHAALHIDVTRPRTVVPHSLAVGFLYWIHPTGLAAVAASVLALTVVSFRSRRLAILGLHALVLGIAVVVYSEGIHSWLLNTGGASGYGPAFEYPSPVSQMARLANPSFLVDTVIKALGQLSYLAVGSLGLAVFGFVEVAGIVRNRLPAVSSGQDRKGIPSVYTQLFLTLALLGVMAMGSVFFATSGRARVDYWIYGRHVEGMLLPFLSFGYLARVRHLWILLLAAGVTACGALLATVAFSPPTNNVVNTISLWPQYLIDRTDFLRWMALGALGILVFQYARQLGRIGRIGAVGLLVGTSVLSGVNAAQYHQDILSDYSRPTGLVEIVRANFVPGQCVGFNPEGPVGGSLFHQERFRLNIFYLHDYRYQRMDVTSWLNGCDGPFFTYNVDQLRDRPGVVLLGQEVRSGLYLVAKDRTEGFWAPIEAPTERTFYPAEDWELPPLDLQRHGEQLYLLPSHVGRSLNGSIVTTGRAGHLVYGPYVVMPAGEYTLVVKGAATRTLSASVDVTSALGKVEHAEFGLSTTGGDSGILASGRVVLDETVYDFEVRVYVGADDSLRLDGYELVPVDAMSPSPAVR